MMRKLMTAMVLCLPVVLGGCEFLQVVSFKSDQKSAYKPNQTTELRLISVTTTTTPGEGDFFTDICNRNITPLAGGLIATVVTAGFSHAYGIVVSQLGDAIDKFKESGSASYGARLVVTGNGDFAANNKCLVLIRHDRDPAPGIVDTEPGLLVVFSISPVGSSAFQLLPVYVAANNALARTAENKPIKLSFGFAAKAAFVEDGKDTVSVFAQDSIAINKVPLDGSNPTLPTSAALLAMPPDTTTALELSIAVVESGSGLPNADRAKADLKAVTDALGPIVQSKLPTP